MKKLNLLAATLGVAALGFVGCNKAEAADAADTAKEKVTKAAENVADRIENAKDRHDENREAKIRADKAREEADDDLNHDLGNFDLGDGYTMKVTQVGNAPAGGEAELELMIELPKGKDVKSVKVWLGDSTGFQLSEVVDADVDGVGAFEAEIDLPETIAAGAKYWVEATFADGKKRKGSWARK